MTPMKRSRSDKEQSKVKRARKDAKGYSLNWTVAPHKVSHELSETLLRIRGLVVIGMNSVTRALENGVMRFLVLPDDFNSRCVTSHVPELAYRAKVPFVVSLAHSCRVKCHSQILPVDSFEMIRKSLDVKRISVFGISKCKARAPACFGANANDPLTMALEDVAAWVYRWQSAPTEHYLTQQDCSRGAFRAPGHL